MECRCSIKENRYCPDTELCLGKGLDEEKGGGFW